RAGRPFPDVAHHPRDPGGHILGARVGVIQVDGAHENDHDLGAGGRQLTVLNAPADVLRAIAADAEIDGAQRLEVPGPDVAPGVAPVIGDRITEEDDFESAGPTMSDELLVPGAPRLVSRCRR